MGKQASKRFRRRGKGRETFVFNRGKTYKDQKRHRQRVGRKPEGIVEHEKREQRRATEARRAHSNQLIFNQLVRSKTANP